MNSKPIYSFYKNSTKTKAHIAHKSLNINRQKRSHPLSVDFLLGCKNKHAIINPIETFEKLYKSLYLIGFFSKNKKSLLIVNTNKDLAHFIENFYQSTRLKNYPVSYCNERWVGGFLTNWKQVSKSVSTFMEFSERFENFIVQNNINFPRYKKMNQSFQGLKKEKSTTSLSKRITGTSFADTSLGSVRSVRSVRSVKGPVKSDVKQPSLIFLINPNENRHVVEEALSLNIPVIAITDSNTNLLGISYPIPGNSNSIEFVHYCLQWITRIIGQNFVKKI